MGRWFLTILVVLLPVSGANAGVVWHFEGEAPGPPIGLSFGGILPFVSVPTTASVDFTLSLEGETRTIYFDSFSFSSAPYSYQRTGIYLKDGSLTERVPITRTITVDPITVSTKHLGPFLLESIGPEDFRIGGIYDDGTLDPFDQVRLALGTSHAVRGSVTVAGPTESLSQTFSFPTFPELQGDFRGAISTSGFPDSVELRRFSPDVGLLDGSTAPFFVGTVDDVSFAAICSGVTMYGESGTIHAESHTPEPAVPWLLLSGFFAALVFACLRMLAKSQPGPAGHPPPEQH